MLTPSREQAVQLQQSEGTGDEHLPMHTDQQRRQQCSSG
jgi:hypothetical protein